MKDDIFTVYRYYIYFKINFKYIFFKVCLKNIYIVSVYIYKWNEKIKD